LHDEMKNFFINFLFFEKVLQHFVFK
jgi:hypothetical protein